VKTSENAVVYILIEKKNRELMSKLLISSELLRKKVDVVIGFFAPILMNIASWPKGVVYTKGLNRVQFELVAPLPDLGHLVVATDEEAMGSSDPKFIVQDTWPEMASVMDRVFCQGEVHRRALIDLRNFALNQTIITGNARVDLLRHPAAQGLKTQSETIKRRHGSFILINTDCGFVNNKVRDQAQFIGLLEKIGWVDPTSEEDRLLVADIFQNDMDNMQAIEAFVRAMEKQRPDRQIILRPHPAERIEHWKAIEKTVSNLTIIQDTEAPAWILAADYMIQTGCTTGVEAAILGTPTLGLTCHPTAVRLPSFLLSNQINPVARTIDEAIDATRQIETDPEGPIGARVEEKRVLLGPHLDIDPARFAFQKIADAIVEMLPEDRSGQDPEIFQYSTKINATLKKKTRSSPFKDAHVTQGELEERLRVIAEFRKIPIPGTVRDLGWGTFLLQPVNG